MKRICKDDSHIRASRFWIKYTGKNDPVAISQFAKMLRSAANRGARDAMYELVDHMAERQDYETMIEDQQRLLDSIPDDIETQRVQ
jgi:hypothetical protein